MFDYNKIYENLEKVLLLTTELLKNTKRIEMDKKIYKLRKEKD